MNSKELKKLMASPKYWRDQDPETVATVEREFKRLYEPDDNYITVPVSLFDNMNDLVLKRSVEVARLEKQVNEANGVITSYIRNNPLEKYGPAEAYCERWQVK